MAAVLEKRTAIVILHEIVSSIGRLMGTTFDEWDTLFLVKLDETR